MTKEKPLLFRSAQACPPDRAGETKYARAMAAPSDSIVDSGSSASSMPIIGSHCQEVATDWR